MRHEGGFKAGDLIGQYRIVGELGRGGMGVVYKAHEASLDRDVAIKVLSDHLSEDASYVQRFLREARSAARLSHPNIVHIHAVGEHGGRHYFVMEFVAGSSLQEVLRRGGPMDPLAAARIVAQTAAGLALAHEHGVIHRDIKPANILISGRGLVKIADFGLALMPSSASRLTATGMFMGTPGYLAPEQCLDQEVGPRTDIYSLGVSYFEMLTGRMPFTADSPFALIRKIVEVEPPDVRELAPGIDDRTRAILGLMMAKDPARRYPGCAQLIGDLEKLVQGGADISGPGSGSTPTTLSPPPSPSSRAPLERSLVDDTSPTLEVDSGAGEARVATGVTPPPLPQVDPRLDVPRRRAGEAGPRRSRTVLLLGGAGVAACLLVGAAAVWWGLAGRDGGGRGPQQAATAPDRGADPAAVSDLGAPAGLPVGGLELSAARDRASRPPTAPAAAGGSGQDSGAAVGPDAPVPTPSGVDGGVFAPSGTVSPEQPSAPVSARPTPVDAREQEIRRLVDQLRSRDSGTRRNAARAIYRSYPREERLLRVVNEQLLDGFARNLEDEYHVDAMAWMCNVLGMSGETRYRSTLERVASEAPNRKIRRFAVKNLERLR